MILGVWLWWDCPVIEVSHTWTELARAVKHVYEFARKQALFKKKK